MLASHFLLFHSSERLSHEVVIWSCSGLVRKESEVQDTVLSPQIFYYEDNDREADDL